MNGAGVGAHDLKRGMGTCEEPKGREDRGRGMCVRYMAHARGR